MLGKWLSSLMLLVMLATPPAGGDPPPAPAAIPAAPAALDVRVDERVELFCIIARLAGMSEYAQRSSMSAYSSRAHAHFDPFREHRAVQLLREMRARDGAGHDAIVSLAVHLGPLPALQRRMPFDPRPPRLDARWKPERTEAFLAAVRDFVRESKAPEYFASETAFYTQAAERLRAVVADAKALPWFDEFFGSKAGATYSVIPGLLCGNGNYGAGVRFEDGRPEEIRPILGCANWDQSGIPVFTERAVPLLVHELCHSYTNSIVDRHADALQPVAEPLFEVTAAAMRRQAYGTWRIMVYESLVRATVVRYLRDVRGDEAAATQIREDASRGFSWIGDLASALDAYVKDRARYPTLDDFMPEIVRFFETRGAAIVKAKREASEKAPKLVAMTPPNGARNVDPGLTEMRLVFDRPMSGDRWSIVGPKQDAPEWVGTPKLDESGKTFVLGMKLSPGRTYSFRLNSERSKGFASADGFPLEPVEVTFSVAE
jgi:hypothetical protein